jgi:hypothetical protein
MYEHRKLDQENKTEKKDSNTFYKPEIVRISEINNKKTEKS